MMVSYSAMGSHIMQLLGDTLSAINEAPTILVLEQLHSCYHIVLQPKPDNNTCKQCLLDLHYCQLTYIMLYYLVAV
jgi:hypothetical protein